MEKRKCSLEVYRMIREAEDLMILKIVEQSKLPKSQSFDDITINKTSKLLEYDPGVTKLREEIRDPKSLIYQYVKGNYLQPLCKA
jgi:hypothetical protein